MSADAAVDGTAWGSEPSDEEWAEVERLNEELRADARERVSEVSAPVDSIAEATGWSNEDIERAIAKGEIVAFEHGGLRVIPLWQFSDDRPARALPAIRELSRAFGNDVIALSAWVSAPNPHLGGRTPQAALRSGDRAAVLSAIASIGAAAF